MPQAQVTPKYVNPAKPGKQYGNIKEASGVKWIIPAGWEHLFAPNVHVHIDYESQTWGSETVNIVRGVNGSMQPIPGPAASVPPPLPPVAPIAQPAPASKPADDPVAEQIFVTGIVGRAMGSGQFSVMDIGVLAKAATQAWRARDRQTPPAGGYTETSPPPAGPGDAR